MSSKSSKKFDLLRYALASAISREKKRLTLQAAEDCVVTLTAPQPPDWWNGDEQFAGLVPRADQEKNMKIKIDEWSEYAQPGDPDDTLQFQWRPAGSGDWQNAQDPIAVPSDGHPGNFPIELELESSNFAVEGNFELRYSVTLGHNATTTCSEVSTFIIDKTPPNDNQSPNKLTFSDVSIDSDRLPHGPPLLVDDRALASAASLGFESQPDGPQATHPAVRGGEVDQRLHAPRAHRHLLPRARIVGLVDQRHRGGCGDLDERGTAREPGQRRQDRRHEHVEPPGPRR